MPDPNEYSDEKEWMSACIPKMMDDGAAQDNDQAVAICANMWEKKSADVQAIVKALKVGAMINKDNRQTVRAIRQAAKQIVDHTVALVADDEDPTPEPAEIVAVPLKSADTLVSWGGEVKALGNGKVGGYLVRFSTADDPDLSIMRDFFTPQTDFGGAQKSTVYYQHGMDEKIGLRSLGEGPIRIDDVGVWIEAQLAMRDEYEKAIYEMASAGKLGWSSGTASHLVDREPVGNAHRIKTWPLGLDASLTPTPAEPRNQVVSLKSLSTLPAAVAETSDKTAALPQSEKSNKENITMDEKDLKALVDALTPTITNATNTAVEQAVKKIAPVAPLDGGVVTGESVNVTGDPADRPFKSIAEQMQAVKMFAQSGGMRVDPRLNRINAKAATGLNEAVPSEGGFLLDPTLTAEILKPMHETGPFLNLVRRLPVGPKSNFGWINGIDESSRATGSRWGGVRGYRMAEADTKNASQPKFRRVNWELKKYAVLMYATDELLEDVAMTNEVFRASALEELIFMANDDILNGLGAAGPLGLLNSPSLISPARYAGSTIMNVDILNMWQRLLPRSRGNAVWFVNSEAEPQLDQLYLTSSLEARYVTYGADSVMRIKGRPVVVTEFNAALGTAGDIVLADMSQYLFWDKDVQTASSIHVQFLTDQTVFRWVYRCDGQPAYDKPITPYKGTNTQSPFVALSASTS